MYITMKQTSGCTSLHYAVMKADLALTELLINNGANQSINSLNKVITTRYWMLVFHMSFVIELF
jgi:ankyrin repeat protein